MDVFSINRDNHFELIELGAGDGSKTMKLLDELLNVEIDFTYTPIDISQNALDGLESKLKMEFPSMNVKPQQGTYFDVLKKINNINNPKVILFLGSNIGNLTDDEASKFIYELGYSLNKGDKILLGVDNIKSKEIVLPAYNDEKGVTKEFNLNLLSRINNELGADFDIDLFDHSPEYKEEEGIAKSYIVSKTDQIVSIQSLDKKFSFTKDESMRTERSRKYKKTTKSN